MRLKDNITKINKKLFNKKFKNYKKYINKMLKKLKIIKMRHY